MRELEKKEEGLGNFCMLIIGFLLILFLMPISYAGDVTVENGRINVNNNIYVATSGNVGIGTIVPSEKLDVTGKVKGTELCIGADCRSSWPSGGSGSQWTTNGSSIYYSSGYVGIGTNSPSTPLNVIGNPGDSNAGTLILGPTSSTNLRLGYNSAAGYSWIQSHFGQPLRINELGNNVILNSGGGNVGIGTVSPANKLTVAGVVALASTNEGAPAASMKHQSNLFSFLGGTSGYSFYDNTGVTQQLFITNTGNVGIATSNPSQRLDVAGYVRGQSGLCIGSDCRSSWPTSASVPSGMIAFFAGSCPSGWSEYAPLRGRYLVGMPSGGTVAGTVGTALTNLAAKSITNVPSHAHTVDPPNTGVSVNINDPGHSHGTYANALTFAGGGGSFNSPGNYDQIIGSATTTSNTAGISASGTVNIASFDSGATGSASVDITMPYIQLVACQAP